MTRYVALLRGVNIAGTSTRVAMADLRSLFEDLGFRDVQTVLNSGNVVFSAAAKEKAGLVTTIQEALVSKLKLDSAITILSAAEVAAAVRENPLTRVATNPSLLLVVVPSLQSGLRRLKPLLEERWAPEALAVGRRVAYLWCARGVAKSPLWGAADRALNRSGTARNIATMTKLMRASEDASG